MSYSIIPQLKLKKPTDTEGTIIIRAFMDRKPITQKSTGHRIDKQYWLPDHRRVSPDAPNSHLLNTAIQKQLQTIQAALLQKEIMGARITPHIIAQAMNGTISISFIQFCRERIAADYKSPETKRVLLGHCTKLVKYQADISFADIDHRFLQGYYNYMRDKLNNCENTLWSGMKFIRTMLNKAIRTGGIIAVNPMDNFQRIQYVVKPQPHLCIADCDKLEEFITDPTQDKALQSVAVRFLLMVYSGMRFSDALSFDSTQHSSDGRLIMKYSKWDERVNYKMHQRLQKIVALVDAHPVQVTNMHFNRQLKIIAGICKIPVKLSSKVGRHTLGYLLADKDVPEEKAQKILGHRDRRSTLVYYHIDEKQVDREVMKLDEL